MSRNSDTIPVKWEDGTVKEEPIITAVQSLSTQRLVEIWEDVKDL
jgi:hypothetical protein